MGDSYHRDEVYIRNESLFRNIFKTTLKKVLIHKKGGRVLEIGSSTGLLLKLFQEKGFAVTGVEPSSKSSRYAIKRGINTITKSFERAKLNGKFDVVILNHVLEHLKDPKEVLNKTWNLLNNDGIIVINVPNAGSLSAKIYGKNWEYVLPKEHLWQFTPTSLSKVIEESGFSIVNWEAKSGIWEFDNPLLELCQSFTGLKKRFFKNFLTIIPTWFISQLKLGTGLSVIAIKN